MQDLQVHPDFLCFLERRAAATDCRVAEAMCNRVGYTLTDDAPNYLLARLDDGQPRVTYTTEARITARGVTGDVYAVGPHRVVAKPGKVLQIVSGIDNAVALSNFTHALAAWLRNEGEEPQEEPRILTGEDIRTWYDEANYCCCHSTGTMARSCMRYSDCSGQMDIYVAAAEMLALFCEECGDLRARAIVWPSDSEQRFIDRIYGNEVDRAILDDYAARQGWPDIYEKRRRGGSFDDCVVTLPVPVSQLRPYPWFDSMASPCPDCRQIRPGGYGCGCPVPVCPVCNTDMFRDDDDDDDTVWRCPNATHCRYCGDTYCGDTCPNGCRYCVFCYCAYNGNDHEACPSCVFCWRCGQTQTRERTRANHGICVSYYRDAIVLPDAATQPVTATWRRNRYYQQYAEATWDCPQCGQASTNTRQDDEHHHCECCSQAVSITMPCQAIVPCGPIVTLYEPLREHYRRIWQRDRLDSRWIIGFEGNHPSARLDSMLSNYDWNTYTRYTRYERGEESIPRNYHERYNAIALGPVTVPDYSPTIEGELN